MLAAFHFLLVYIIYYNIIIIIIIHTLIIHGIINALLDIITALNANIK